MRHSHRHTTAYRWALFVLTVAMSDAAMAQEYTLTDLGRVEGYDHALGIAVNNLGQVAGYAWTTVWEPPHFPYRIHRALVYSDGSLTDLSAPPGTESLARGINDAGKVAGSQNGDGVIWEELGGVWQITTQLGPLPGGTDPMSASGINNQGQVAGTANVAGYLHAGLWESGTTLDLGTLPAGDWSMALGINDQGEVVGHAKSNGVLTDHAFLWLPEPAYGMPAGMNDLGTLGERLFSRAHDVNDTGQVVGYSANPDRAFLWDNGVMTDLGAIINAESQANGINNLGLVVGKSWSIDPWITSRGVLWDGGVLHDLNELVVDAPGWFISEAHDINDAGQIVGEGVHPNGEYHAVLLTPREIAVPKLTIDLDIKPGSEPNAVNPTARGILPVAILGADSFDVADVDATTLAFGPGEAAPLHSSGGHAEDVNDDGYTDWVSHYRIEEAGVAAGDTELCLTGETLDGTPIEGCDAIVTVPYVGERRRVRVNRQR